MKNISIELNQVSTNNLKSINVKFPLYKLTSVTGVSGSGKSSLVFDTLYAESYRRYVESLSSFARQYLKALPKPKIYSVNNLPPSIAVQQSRSGVSNRSTVGTMTEMNDILRVIFTHLGRIKCQVCSKIVESADPDKIGLEYATSFQGGRILILASISNWEGISNKDLVALLQAQGFTRFWIKGGIFRVDSISELNRSDSWVVIDRISVEADAFKRISEALQVALKLGRGRCAIASDGDVFKMYSKNLECCGIQYREPTMALFSFNHPIGACETCQGFGSSTELDSNKIIPDLNIGLLDEGVVCWNFGEHKSWYKDAFRSMQKMKFDLKKKRFSEYSEKEMKWLWDGDGENFTGIRGYFEWLDTKRYKAHYRIHAARFRKYITCPLCLGRRLNLSARSVFVQGLTICDVSQLSFERLTLWISKISPSELCSVQGRDAGGQEIEEAIGEGIARLNYLNKMGLSYLSLDRNAKTLSGGELQRINMSRCLGSILTDTLFCLDEPTAGLHSRDSANLLNVMLELRDQGNTVVVVEHERTIINGSDHFIEIGPKAGHEGGYVVFEGASNQRKQVIEQDNFTSTFDGNSGDFFSISGAKVHNLKNVKASFPVGKITGICGVSGSGKTSIIRHCLLPLLHLKLNSDGDLLYAKTPEMGEVGPDHVLNLHSQVAMVSQIALGRSSRSTIATYLGIMDYIRKIFAAEELSSRLGLSAGSFSFNSVGGRCETCRGLGTVVEDLSFLGDMEILCPACNGARFQEDVLSVTYRGKNLTDVLALTASEARTFFFDHRGMVRCLEAVLKVGMGYVTLGQSTSSFSGGEAQRLKLIQLLSDAKRDKPSIFIFDEPTAGLRDQDVLNLFAQFKELSILGHTVLIIEHHLSVLRHADWLIEMGPEAAEKGGAVVYMGIPRNIKSSPESITKNYL